MKIRSMSDLHLEFDLHNTASKVFEVSDLPDDKETILLLNGDVVTFRQMEDCFLEDFLCDLSGRFKHVFYIAGNHEFWGGDFNGTLLWIKDICDPIKNVDFLENSSKVIDGVAFIGASLWTDFDNGSEWCMNEASRFMNDYHKTQDMTVEGVLARHKESRKYIFEEIIEQKLQGNKVVVMTHHLPSFKSIDSQYRHSSVNGAYASNLDEEIEAHGPDIWLHGHTHHNTNYIIKDTRVICNPRGYYGYDINFDFDPLLTFEI